MNIEQPSARFLRLPGMNREDTKNEQQPAEERRLRVLNFLPNSLRNHFVAGAGEFVGTFAFLFLAFSTTQVANAAAAGATVADGASGKVSQVPNVGVLLYISLSFGFSLAVNAWVFFRISGGLFNPAVTLGMALIGAVRWVRASVAVLAQMLGAMAAAAVVYTLFPGPLAVTTTLNPATSVVRGLFIEMFLTAQLVFTIFMLAAEKHKGTFIAPIGIGLALFVSEMSGVYFTGRSLNPARSFGPCVVLLSFPNYHWIYWVGPSLGSLIAVTFYRLIKTLEYENANPGQDSHGQEADLSSPQDNASTAKEVARADSQVNLAGSRSIYPVPTNDSSVQGWSPPTTSRNQSYASAPSLEGREAASGRHRPAT